jgi:hypothetical protein
MHYDLIHTLLESRISNLRPPPEPLYDLYTAITSEAREFRHNIWHYNRALSFTSLGVTEDWSVNQHSAGPPVFRIQGDLYHRIGNLLPSEGQNPTYAQIYIYEPRESIEYRIHNNPDLNRTTLSSLQNILTQYNPYVQIFYNAGEILAQYPATSDISIRLQVIDGSDRRTHNLPATEEVAVILPNSSVPTDHRDILLRRRSGPLHHIDERHPAYSPLQYPLLFPFGDHGWHDELYMYNPQSTNPHSLSQTRYAAYRLHSRRNEFSTILHSNRLLQRYIVDCWATADQYKLTWLQKNQNHLRSELYSGLEDIVDTDEQQDINLCNIGQRTVLPSSYIGGPRHMQQKFQDSMAIARYFRQVDLFITMTANANWPEIHRELYPGQTPFDRPDLVTRVFHMKKDALLHDIYKDGIFGPCVAYVYTIEFQKRGLPHMHLLLFLKPGCKLTTTTEIDSVISATLPDRNRDPKLFETISSCMVHGPCGAFNPRAPCMENGKCTKW